MKLEFPYQLTTLLAAEPAIGEPVYEGANGWYPQIALKRRFKVTGMTEGDLIAKIDEFCRRTKPFTITTGELMQPETMPVKVVAVRPSTELITFHNEFISFLGEEIISRFPERDGANYLPHVTAEYNGKMVIDPAQFTNKKFVIDRIYLLKDIDNEDSVAYKSFELKHD